MEAPATTDALTALRARLAVVADLRAAASVLEWDQETYMPPGAAEARAHQLATLKTLAHEHFTHPEIVRLLEAAADAVDGRPEDDASAALVRVTRRDVARQARLSADFVARQAEAVALAKEAWKQARQDSNFAHFAPHLERLVGLAREQAEALGYDDQPYDALLEEYEPGMTTREVAGVFEGLRAELVPIVEALAEAEPPDDTFLHRPFDEEKQWAFGLDTIRAFGYDFGRGRQDRSAHPFSTTFAISDVRITTRVQPDFFPTAFFGTLHEAGHALYEQGIDPALARTPLADGTSLGMHESQSRLWENLVGRSAAFWRGAYPKLQQTFPDALGGVGLDAFLRAVNKVQPSPIRVEADEVTYNLHVMLRFELETALLDGSLAVADVPAAWNEKMRETLGLTPETDAEGCLQDIHWSLGALGYFPTYALGNLMSVPLFDQARADLGDLDEQMAAGRFEGLLG
ncbi:MAG: carboxypeptidase M32, partial [Rhodothermales bacterium]|nr:carboxypeptidase M32 [Rhodothermales bacterium]